MYHQAMKDKLFALYDGELAGTERREVEAHLASCPECYHSYMQWQQTAKALFQAPQVRTSEAFIHQIMQRIDVLERPHRVATTVRSIRWLVPAIGLASLLLFILVPARRTVSVETLLLADGRENTSTTRFVLASEPPTTDEIFGFLTEGQP